MDYDASDSSGTDDDLLPSHQNRTQRGGRVTGNGRSRIYDDIETQIHLLEQEAYCAVLRAFQAQSDALTWDKETVITNLRKELRVTDEDHRELLGRVNKDDVILRIREWRQTGGLQPGLLSTAQGSHDLMPNSVSRKRQKISQTIPSLLLSAPPPLFAAKRGGAGEVRGKKTKSTLPGISSIRPMQYNPLVGRKVWTRWPADNSFYEAVITDYNPIEGLHALVYDKDTPTETWEWVNLKEISPDDIRWEGEDLGIAQQGGRGVGNGNRKSLGRGGAVLGAGRGRGSIKSQPRKDFPPAKNGIAKKILDEIEMHETDNLIKEVERVFSLSHPDSLEVERAKKLLKEHEQTLIDAITRLAEASDGESGNKEEGDRPVSHGRVQSANGDAMMKNQQNNIIDVEMGREDKGEGINGDPIAVDEQHDGVHHEI